MGTVEVSRYSQTFTSITHKKRVDAYFDMPSSGKNQCHETRQNCDSLIMQ